ARKSSEQCRIDVATTSTHGPTIHRIQISALSYITTSKSNIASVVTAELENFQ
ncbi:hypothetical protein ACJMK2_022482, partial [Sinanodonta woodiana]